MRRRLYILAVWTATLGVLLSMVVMHHHHYERVCMVVEECAQDGHINDEHTHHHEGEREGCQIHQMHHFLVKANGTHTVVNEKMAEGNTLSALFSSYFYYLPCGLAAVLWQQHTMPLSHVAIKALSLRGPPALSFS